MNRFVEYNANPKHARVGDCVIRAVSNAIGKEWGETYIDVCLQGYTMADMPSSNVVWGAYLKQKGFERMPVPNNCPDCYTLEDFCKDHDKGVFVVALPQHVVCVKDGYYFDTWDSGSEVPLYAWKKGEQHGI